MGSIRRYVLAFVQSFPHVLLIIEIISVCVMLGYFCSADFLFGVCLLLFYMPNLRRTNLQLATMACHRALQCKLSTYYYNEYTEEKAIQSGCDVHLGGIR